MKTQRTKQCHPPLFKKLGVLTDPATGKPFVLSKAEIEFLLRATDDPRLMGCEQPEDARVP
jgi:hypothetical protein